MSIKKEDIKYVAHLSRITIPDDHIKRFTRQLTDIISYVNKLKKVDTEHIPPTSHPLPLKNVFRKDKVKKSLNTKDVIRIAPQKKENFFKVPRVIEET